MCPEEEFCTATMEPGTLCALMTGIPLEMRLECSVQLQAIILQTMVMHCSYIHMSLLVHALYFSYVCSISFN